MFLPGRDVVLGGKVVVDGCCCFGGGGNAGWGSALVGNGGSREGGSAFFGGGCEVEAVDPFDPGSLSSAMTRLASDFDDALLRQISRPARGDPLLRDDGDNDFDPPSPSLTPSEGRIVLGGVRGRDGFFKGGGGGNESIIV